MIEMRSLKGYKVSVAKAAQTKSQLRRLAKLASQSLASKKNGAPKEATADLAGKATPNIAANNDQGNE